MEKTKTLAKRILSVALATMIVLSFALISVSALPGDYTQVGTNGEFIDFENGQKPHLSPENGNVHTFHFHHHPVLIRATIAFRHQSLRYRKKDFATYLN